MAAGMKSGRVARVFGGGGPDRGLRWLASKQSEAKRGAGFISEPGTLARAIAGACRKCGAQPMLAAETGVGDAWRVLFARALSLARCFRLLARCRQGPAYSRDGVSLRRENVWVQCGGVFFAWAGLEVTLVRAHRRPHG